MGPEAKYKLFIYSNFAVIFAVQSARGNVKQDRNVSLFKANVLAVLFRMSFRNSSGHVKLQREHVM